jgi:hypothetical protein
VGFLEEVPFQVASFPFPCLEEVDLSYQEASFLEVEDLSSLVDRQALVCPCPFLEEGPFPYLEHQLLYLDPPSLKVLLELPTVLSILLYP